MAICGDTVSTVTLQYIYYIAVPEIIEFKNYKASLTMKWEDILGADEYIVYRKVYGESKWTEIDVDLEYEVVKDGEEKTTYVIAKDTSVTAGKKYVYTIVSGDGEDYSARYEKGWTTRFLKNPTIKSVANDTSGVKITWSKASGASKYYVYRKTSKSGKWSYIGSTKTTSYTDKKVSNGKKYYYAVKSMDGDSASYHSTSHFNDICKSITFISAPKPSSVKSSKSGVTFKWSKVSGVSGYYVYRKTGTGSYKKIATVKGSTKVSYLDKSAKKGKTYTYMVKAYSGSTTSAYRTGLKIKDKY
jgi:hypothetical protein